MMKTERAKVNTAEKKGSLSRLNSVCLTFCLLLLSPFATKTFSQPPDPSQIPEPQIAYALHATWTLTLPTTTLLSAQLQEQLLFLGFTFMRDGKMVHLLSSALTGF